MGFLTKEGLQNLTNKLVQGDAIKVASHRGKNVKEVIDNIQRECENVALPNTMTLENRVNEFKVGQGRDVDVSGDVEEGKINVELQGKTYQNLTGFGVGFQTQHSGVFEKIDDEDSLLVKRINSNDSGWAYWHNNKLKRTLIKPNTKYTLLFKFDSNKNHNLQVSLRDGSSRNPISNQISATRVFSNIYMVELTTVSSFDELGNGQVVYLHGGVPPKNGDWSRYYKDIILLEGDHTQTPLEELPRYFEGIKSSFEDGVVDVEVQGKNLFDGQLRTFNTNDTYIDNIGQHHNGDNNIPIKPNTSYTMTFETISGDSNIYIWNGNEKVLTIPSGKDTVSFRTPLKCNSLSFYRSVADYTKDRLKYKIQLEENSKSTSYEPYYKKKISFNIGEPLRSLPNGAYDEIRNNNGQWELVRRTATAIINGTEPWERSYSDWNNIVFCCSDNYFPGIRSIDTSTKNVIANTLPSIHIAALCSVLGNTGICTHNWSTKKMQVAIKDIDTVEKLKAWFTNNPTKVIYELTKPIITPIEPIEFNISQGSTINISSDIAPASTHKVILNRAGQIEQGIELITNLKSRINELENIYDSNLIATQYRIDNLKLNYELEREED